MDRPLPPHDPAHRNPAVVGLAPTLSFRALARDDLPRLRRWLNTPHVYEWWGAHAGMGALGGPGDAAATAAQVEAKYGPTLDYGGTTHRFVILAEDAPIGLIQWYALADYADYARAMGEASEGAAAIDLFIGEPAALGQGLGSRALDAFVATEIFRHPAINRVVAGPAVTNGRSLRAFAKAGFVRVREAGVPGEAIAAAVMVRVRP